MKSINSLVLGYDVCCLIALAFVPFILRESFVTQLVNYILISLVAFYWMKGYFQKIKNRNVFLTLSWYLRLITIVVPLMMLLWIIGSKVL